MKVEGRYKIVCRKKLPNGVTERFEVVIPYDKRNEIMASYRERGYKVF